MAGASNPKTLNKTLLLSQSQSLPSALADDDDFQDPSPSQLRLPKPTSAIPSRKPLAPYNNNNTASASRPSKKPKQHPLHGGKENIIVVGKCAEDSDSGHKLDSSRPTKKPKQQPLISEKQESDSEDLDLCHGLDSIESTIDGCSRTQRTENEEELKKGYLFKSIEARLLNSDGGFEERKEGSEECSELDLLLKLCGEEEDEGDRVECFGLEDEYGLVCCPLCGADISDLSGDMREVHTNECLDNEETPAHVVTANNDVSFQCPGQVLNDSPCQSPKKIVHVSPVVEWLRNLGLAKYEEIFVREEIDWDALKSLTEEDLFSIGITALGPRKKIINSILELRKETAKEKVARRDVTKVVPDDADTKPSKLITDYFIGSVSERKRVCSTGRAQTEVGRTCSDASRKRIQKKNPAKSAKSKDIPMWCSVPGTPFRVDAFKYLRRDCSHWFLSHFHLDHYQGLTKSFCHGKIYCSSITAKLVNLKIGIPWDKIQVLPINQKINIEGIDVICFDANHCPGSLIILFEPPNGKAVLHTGDFRFCEEMTRNSILQTCGVHTLILDTTYCDPQYDFPKQEAVIQFVIESIQAETFNSKTLFLIGSYTIGKERLFVEVARALQKKVYITASKLRILQCLGFPREDMQFFTLNEQESQIHVVPMWTLASFKRLKYVSNQYAGRYSLIVAFSPTGWSFGKGKKKSTGSRWQQGTIIRYEVPYSEHSSFSELKEFVKFVSPVNIIPSVNNHGPESSNAMVSCLLD
ncbi:PREDICTED: DNA cross-link repair 1A protein [Nicotiana attenuata]|uniref:Dna cross-link repair protein snm1 n=1 Tax=Nicotiana attenuata TaxID=49451 RepID=A0A314L4L2_NICAT|nr:PREDICTED: DNA cross-link repair 1A protein [Nicotiana attenuata]OIT36530.1 dna cross-link repair protein snm1 [Nicotiana attenuata]